MQKILFPSTQQHSPTPTPAPYNVFIPTLWARLLSCPVMGAVHITVWSTISDFISLASLNWYFPLFSSSIKRAFTNARRGVTMETMTRGGPVCRGCPCLQGRRRNSPSFWNVLMKTSMAFAENNSIQARFWLKSFWTTKMRKAIEIIFFHNSGRQVKATCTCLDLITNLNFTGEKIRKHRFQTKKEAKEIPFHLTKPNVHKPSS